LGYSSLNDRETANKLNEIGASSETIAEGNSLDVNIIIDNCVKTEIDALTTNKTLLFAGLIARDTIHPGKFDPVIKAIFAPGTTRDNLVSLANRSASRAEVLFGADISVTQSDVQKAREM
jgi:hypothetical protein